MGKGVDYKVESKEQIRRLTKAGELEIVYRMWATSKGGTYYSVDVPEAELASADDLLTRRARQLDAI